MRIDPVSLRAAMARIGGCSALLLLGACAGLDGRIWRSEGFTLLRDAGYRIAIIPFGVSAPREGLASVERSGWGGLLALDGMGASAPSDRAAGALMRRALVAAISAGRFQIADPWATDTLLRHRGITPAEARRVASAAIVARALGVDGLLYGEVFVWNRSQGPTGPVQRVGLDVRLVDGGSGALLFAEHCSRRGAAIPAELARSVVRRLATDLTGMPPPIESNVGAARGNLPRLSLAALAPRRPGPLREGDEVRVIALGDAGADVRFDIGRYRTDIPMIQVSRASGPRGDLGRYIGSYVVQAGEHLRASPVYVSIRSADDPRGARSIRRIRAPLVEIDAVPAARGEANAPATIFGGRQRGDGLPR